MQLTARLLLGACLLCHQLGSSGASWAPDVVSLELLGEEESIAEPELAAGKLDSMWERRIKPLGGWLVNRKEIEIIERLIAMRELQVNCGASGLEAFRRADQMRMSFASRDSNSLDPVLYSSLGPMALMISHFRAINMNNCKSQWQVAAAAAREAKEGELVRQVERMIDTIWHHMERSKGSSSSSTSSTTIGGPNNGRGWFRELWGPSQASKEAVKQLPAKAMHLLEAVRAELKGADPFLLVHLSRPLGAEASRAMARRLVQHFVVDRCAEYQAGWELERRQFKLLPLNYELREHLEDRCMRQLDYADHCASMVADRQAIIKYLAAQLRTKPASA